MKKYVEKKHFCEIALPTQKNNILGFNQYMKSDKIPYIIHAEV